MPFRGSLVIWMTGCDRFMVRTAQEEVFRMSVVTLIGAGQMASALTFPLFENGHEVRLVGSPLDDGMRSFYGEDSTGGGI